MFLIWCKQKKVTRKYVQRLILPICACLAAVCGVCVRASIHVNYGKVKQRRKTSRKYHATCSRTSTITCYQIGHFLKCSRLLSGSGGASSYISFSSQNIIFSRFPTANHSYTHHTVVGMSVAVREKCQQFENFSLSNYLLFERKKKI